MEFAELMAAIDAGGTTALFLLFLLLFMRGDIVSKKTVEVIVDRILSDIVTRVIASVDDLIREHCDELKDELCEWRERVEEAIRREDSL